jgi:hypothetical protein
MNASSLADTLSPRNTPAMIAGTTPRYDLIIVDPTNSLGIGLASAWPATLGTTLVIADDASAAPLNSTAPLNSVASRHLRQADLIAVSADKWPMSDNVALILPSAPSRFARGWLASCREIAKNAGARRICVLSSCADYWRDEESYARWEAESVRILGESSDIEVGSLRVGQVVDASRQYPGWLASWSNFAPLAPNSLASVFPTLEELRETLASLFAAAPSRFAVPRALLGANRPVGKVLDEFAERRAQSSLTRSLCQVAAYLGARQVLAILFAALMVVMRRARPWRISTLSPNSVAELLRWYRAPNHRHVALAGHNTGVVHFGWKYPGRTVVRTTQSGRRIRVRDNFLTVDAGVTLKQVTETLRSHGKELSVVPNYSYIGMGTCFMVPIHGSGSQASTLGDSIQEVLVYDPTVDQIRRARRGDGQFEQWMYHPASGVLVLRLRLRIRDQSRFHVRRRKLDSPEARDLWKLLTQTSADNIELRKSLGRSTAVEVNEYFATSAAAPGALETPRDGIGRIWDRIEETPVAAWLFHWYVREFGHHVELFLNESEFVAFWQAHDTLPLSKIQLRVARRDGLPHSPFGDGDRVSVDLFLKRSQRALFAAFLEEHLPHARINPGKHSL